MLVTKKMLMALTLVGALIGGVISVRGLQVLSVGGDPRRLSQGGKFQRAVDDVFLSGTGVDLDGFSFGQIDDPHLVRTGHGDIERGPDQL